MDCQELQKFLQLFVDGEFDEREQGEVQGHLRSCTACRRQAQFEKWFRDGLRKSLPPAPMPPGLRDRILAELDRESRRRPLARIGRVAAPQAAMVVLAVLVGVIWSMSNYSPFAEERTAPPLPRMAATSALPPAAKAAVMPPVPAAAPAPLAKATAPIAAPASAPVRPGERELELEVVSSDPDELRSYLNRKLTRNIEVPTFRGEAQLVGGSVSDDDATAQLVYRRGDDHLTLHVTARRDPSVPRKGIVVRQEGAHQVALWKKRGLTYSMASLLDPVEMVRLVAAELRGTPPAGFSAPPAWASRERNFSEAMPVSTTEP